MRWQAQDKSLNEESVLSWIFCWGWACSRAAWSSKGLQSCVSTSSCLGTFSRFWCSVCFSSVFCIIQPLSSLLDTHKAGLYFTFQMPCWRITMIWIRNLFYHSFSLKQWSYLLLIFQSAFLQRTGSFITFVVFGKCLATIFSKWLQWVCLLVRKPEAICYSHFSRSDYVGVLSWSHILC